MATMPSISPEKKIIRYRGSLLVYLSEAVKNEAAIREMKSLPFSRVRAFFHNIGADAYLPPVLEVLSREGLLTVWREGKAGVIYLSDDLLEGRHDAAASN